MSTTLGWSAGQISEAVQAGRLSAVDVVHERRDAVASSDLGALVATDWSAAERRAAQVDRLVAEGANPGALAGVPVTVKDVIAVHGMPTTAGSAALQNNRTLETAPAITALVEAGAIVIGKTNCPEFAFGVTTENALHGRTVHPFRPERSVGGSSGGEAAALAAGLSALGVGTDFGGSLRWPAQCTGIVALRPTVGRVPAAGQVPGAGGVTGAHTMALPSLTSLQGQLQVVGPLARTVSDLSLALRVMASSGGAELHAGPVALGTAKLGTLRVAWADGTALGPVRGEMRALIGRVAAELSTVVRSVSELPQVFTACLEPYSTLRALDPQLDHLLAVEGNEHLVSQAAMAAVHASFMGDPRLRSRAWGRALSARQEALAVFNQVDVVLLPVACGPACELDGTLDVDGTTVGGFDLMAQCRAVTMTGAPAVSVPVGTSAEGLPLSVQVVAAPWREVDALAVAAAVGADYRSPWAPRDEGRDSE
jgi:amidase